MSSQEQMYIAAISPLMPQDRAISTSQNTTPAPRGQRWSTPVEPPSKNYSSPPRSRSRRHSTTEEVSPTDKLSSNDARFQFREVDWGDNGKRLRERVSEISRCASDAERLIDGYLEEHSQLQKKLKLQSKVVNVPSIKTSRPNGIKVEVSSNEGTQTQSQRFKDRISELEEKIKGIEKDQQKKISEHDRSSHTTIQRMNANHKIEVESLRTQLADINLKLQNQKAKADSLTDQKVHHINEKCQLQNKLEDQTRQTERLQSLLREKKLEAENLQLCLHQLQKEHEEGIKKYNTVRDEANALRDIIRNCKYCAGIWEFTQHRGSIDVNVWYCDISQDGNYSLPLNTEPHLAEIEAQPAENFRQLVHDIEKLCSLVALHGPFLEIYMKEVAPESLDDFRICLQQPFQTLEPEIFLPFLQREIWRLSLQSQHPQSVTVSPTDLEDNIKSQLKLSIAESNGINLNYPHLKNLISAIVDSFSNLFTILKSFSFSSHDQKDYITISLNPQNNNKGFDLFPIIRRTDGGLLVGHISVKNIEENAIIIPITPVVYRSNQILVQGTAIVYERKRSALTVPVVTTPKKMPISGTPLPSHSPPISKRCRRGTLGEDQEEYITPYTTPPRPPLHRKPKLPPLDTAAVTATPTNSPVLHRNPKPPLPTRKLTSAAATVAKTAESGSTRSITKSHTEAKDSGAKVTKELTPAAADVSFPPAPAAIITSTAHDNLPSTPISSSSGTPLAAIWRTLEQLDKKNVKGF
ncbi:hypothetical protein TWF730_009015 [Orbilia blumenaviensis]|uniref:Uncharacterized protein n=1 Tax=Orbilia blumenaviensis TaxID=1796055 RepID=A0AAV9UY08_9PEZI